MGLFTSRPYSMSSLNGAEKSAVRTALEVAKAVGVDGKLGKSVNTAIKELQKGKMSKDSLTTSIAALVASLAALSGSEDPDRSTLLKQKQVAQVVMVMALDKLKNML